MAIDAFIAADPAFWVRLRELVRLTVHWERALHQGD
jgi:hypothetical protein